MPQVVVQVKPALARALRDHLAGGTPPLDPDAQELLRLVDQLGLVLEPVFPRADTVESGSLFFAAVPGTGDHLALTDRLRQSPAVDSVFVKPDDSPP